MANAYTASKRPQAKTCILRHAKVREKLGLSESKLFDMVARGVFPPPFQIVPGGRAVGWLESDVDAWILDQKHRSGEDAKC
jgi:prophage regulatory protein